MYVFFKNIIDVNVWVLNKSSCVKDVHGIVDDIRLSFSLGFTKLIVYFLKRVNMWSKTLFIMVVDVYYALKKN